MADKEKDYTIIVNAQEKSWNKKEISFEELVTLAFGSISDNPNIIYTVGYAKGNNPKKEGSLVPGQSVKVKDGMVFNVTQTDKS